MALNQFRVTLNQESLISELITDLKIMRFEKSHYFTPRYMGGKAGEDNGYVQAASLQEFMKPKVFICPEAEDKHIRTVEFDEGQTLFSRMEFSGLMYQHYINGPRTKGNVHFNKELISLEDTKLLCEVIFPKGFTYVQASAGRVNPARNNAFLLKKIPWPPIPMSQEAFGKDLASLFGDTGGQFLLKELYK